MAAQFFVSDPNAGQNNVLGHFQAGYDSANAMREAERKKKFEATFSRLIDAKGNLDQGSFYKAAQEQGLSPDQIREAMRYRQDQLTIQDKTAQSDTTERALGYNPTAGGRNNATVGPTADSILPGMVKVDSPSMQGAAPPIGPSSIDPDKLPNPADVGPRAPVEQAPVAQAPVAQAPAAPNKLESWFTDLKNMSKADVKKVQAQVGLTGKDVDGKAGKLTKAALASFLSKQTQANASAADTANEAGGTVNITAPMQAQADNGYKMAPDTVGPDVFAPAQDNRTFDQQFQDSYRKENSLASRAGGLAGAGSSELTTWAPKDDGSNEFRQYAKALADMLTSTGFADASTFLQHIRDEAIRANTPTRPNEGLLMLGPEGQAKYQGELNAYEAALAKAEGLANAKVMEARVGLADYARKFGVDTQTSEKFDADMGGRRAGEVSGAGVVRTRAVSDAEKAIGDRTASAYQDISSAKDRFAQAASPDEKYSAVMSAINATLKADGASLNADNVVAMLVSAGMVPPERAQATKQLMSESPGGISDAIIRLGKTTWAGGGDPAQAIKWFDDRIKNVRGQLKLAGYDVLGAKDQPAPKSGAQKAFESKVKASKAKKNTRGTVD